MAKKSNIYYDGFVEMINLSCKAAEYLQDSLKNFDPATLTERRTAMHEIEHAEDNVKHELLKRLAREFVTPIDREDIIQLANELDDVTDKIDDILIRMYMYGIKKVPEDAIVLAGVVSECCRALQGVMNEFPRFLKPEELKKALVEVNTMEEKGDEIYIGAVRKLYQTGGEPLEISAWSELFDRLEDCCDACEHVADVVEMIIMKNS